MEKFKFENVKREEFELLKQIIPWAFDDGSLNIDKLNKEFNDLQIYNDKDDYERYGLYWLGKSLSKGFAYIDSQCTLKPNKIESLNFDEANNIIISGDNLEVLKLLKLNYNNKVDLIYIDPPYNTGSDLIYKDNFSESVDDYKKSNKLVDEENNNLTTNSELGGRFHTNWLDMIYPRLLLSRQLLKEDGLIFISIDENEYSRLKLVCDEIFGENNFISTIIWEKKNSGSAADSKYIKVLNEYILIYTKNKSNVYLNRELLDVKNDPTYTETDEFVNVRGKYKLKPFSVSGLTYSKDSDYEIVIDNKIFYAGNSTKEQWLERRNNHASKDYQWRWSKEKFKWGLENKYIVVKNNSIQVKQYQYVDKDANFITRVKPFSNIILNSFVNSGVGTDELKDLFGGIKIFDHPKPTKLLTHLINLHKNKDALVLDFFAGSGSTGHAVMKQNLEDGGNRKYILVQINEKINNEAYKSIVDITKERIKRCIEKFNYKDKGFKFFQLSNSNFLLDNMIMSNENNVENLKLNIENQTKLLKDGIDELDLVYEIGLKNNHFTLDQNIVEHSDLEQRYYSINNGDSTTFFFFHPFNSSSYYGDIYIYIVDKVKQELKNTKNIKVYLLDHLFISDEQKIELGLRLKELSDQINVVVI